MRDSVNLEIVQNGIAKKNIYEDFTYIARVFTLP